MRKYRRTNDKWGYVLGGVLCFVVISVAYCAVLVRRREGDGETEDLEELGGKVMGTVAGMPHVSMKHAIHVVREVPLILKRKPVVVVAEGPGTNSALGTFLSHTESADGSLILITSKQYPMCVNKKVTCIMWSSVPSLRAIPTYLDALSHGVKHALAMGAGYVVAVAGLVVPQKGFIEKLYETLFSDNLWQTGLAGCSWVTENSTVLQHGLTVEWDSSNSPYLRNRYSGASLHDSRAHSAEQSPLISPLCFAASPHLLTRLRPLNSFTSRLSDAIACEVKSLLQLSDVLSTTTLFVFDSVIHRDNAAAALAASRERLVALMDAMRRPVVKMQCNVTDIAPQMQVIQKLQVKAQITLATCSQLKCDGVSSIMKALTELAEATADKLKAKVANYSSWVLRNKTSVADLGLEAGLAWVMDGIEEHGLKTATSVAKVKYSGQVHTAVANYSMLKVVNVTCKDLQVETQQYSVQDASMFPLSEQFSMQHKRALQRLHPRHDSDLLVVWDAWCCRCCGFSNEWAHYLYTLEKQVRIRSIPGAACHCTGLPQYIQGALERVQLGKQQVAATESDIFVWISHTPPPSYMLNWDDDNNARSPDYFIGRSMYEFSSIPQDWAANCNSPKVGEIWVPSEFVLESFASAGVERSKLCIIPEAIDTYYYDPTGIEAAVIPKPEWRHYSTDPSVTLTGRYVMLSIFKWEARKGWDVLLSGYLKEFSIRDKVTLVVVTWMWYPTAPEEWGPTRDPVLFQDELFRVAEGLGMNTSVLPHVVFITENLDESEVRELYASCDAFVLPTRGEGWGLPLVQAMAMQLPTIATGWGGTTAFMKHTNSYLVRHTVVDLPQHARDLYKVDMKQWAEV